MATSLPPNGQYALWGAVTESDKAAGLSPPLRNSLYPTGPIPTETAEGAKTIWEIFEQSVKKCGDDDFAGYRTLLKRDLVKSKDGKKTFEKVDLSEEYYWRSFNQVKGRVDKLASGMVSELGLAKGDRVLIFAETQPAWLETAYACWRQNVTVVTAYATLGEEGVTSAINQCKSSVCVCDARLLNIVVKCKANCPTLKHIVIIPTKVDPSQEESQKTVGDVVKISSTELLIEKGEKTIVPSNACAPDDVAVLMYTSGTTGNSKGVIMTHSMFVSSVRGLREHTAAYLRRGQVLMAYLPLAHSMELITEILATHLGICLGYGSPQTLTDTGVKLNKGQRGDAPLCRPHVMIFAPAVLDKVYNGVLDKVRGTSKEGLFNRALASGYANFDNGGVGASCCWNSLVFKKSVQVLVGGRLEAMLTGSAPCSAEIQKFAQTAFNAPCRQGYGLTETCAASCIGHIADNKLASVGAPTPATVIRLRDWPEGGYTNADVDNPSFGMRRGEVLIGGPTVSPAYFVDETNPDEDVVAKNKEDWTTINGERYFCSGDVGQVTPQGQVMIVDRKKDLFKGASGEYVSLSKVESLIKLSPYVEMPMAYGRTGAKGIIALVLPKKPVIDNFAQEYGVQINGNYAEAVKNPKIIEAVTKSVIEICRQGGLNGFEIPTACALCIAVDGTPAWTPENDNLTTTMKLKRPIIAKNFAAQIDEAYSRA